MKGCVETEPQKNISASAESNGVVFLVERGDCLFVDKALAAEMHGVGASLCTCFSVSAPACVSALFVTMPCIQPLLCHAGECDNSLQRWLTPRKQFIFVFMWKV